MPVKRSIWLKETINRNYLINIIHQQKPVPLPPARAGVTAAEKRDSANLSGGAIYGLPNQLKFLDIQRGIKIFYPKIF